MSIARNLMRPLEINEKQHISSSGEIEEDRMSELIQWITTAITQTSMITLGGLHLKPKEVKAIKEQFPQVNYENGILILRERRYILPRRQKSLVVIEEGKDENVLEMWKKTQQLKPRRVDQKDWLSWLFGEISPRVIETLKHDYETLYTKDELAHIIRFCRFDITDEKEFNYVIQGLFENGDIMKQKVTTEEGYTDTYYGLTKKYKTENPQIQSQPQEIKQIEITSELKITGSLNTCEAHIH